MKSSKENFENQTQSFDDDLKQLNDEFQKLFLKKFALEHAEKQIDIFSDFEKEDPAIDVLANKREQLDQTIENMLDNCQAKRRRKQMFYALQKVTRRAAAFLVVMMAGFMVLFFSVDAVKLNVVNLIVRSHELSTQFRIQDIMGNMPQDIPQLTEQSFRRPGYIPERFSEMTYDFVSGHGHIAYEASDTPYILSYSCMELSSAISLDTEDCMKESVSINSYHGYLYTKYRGEMKGHTSLIWQDGNYIYLISGPVNKKESLKIAESLY